jgi:phage FluMu protein Com
MAVDHTQLLRQIRCSGCGRFLGLGYIEEGEVYLKCKNCKTWTVVLGGKAEKNLTGKEMYERILAGQKVREVQLPTL